MGGDIINMSDDSDDDLEDDDSEEEDSEEESLVSEDEAEELYAGPRLWSALLLLV